MSTPNPFAGMVDQWNDVTRKAKYNSGTPQSGPNPFTTGKAPDTGKPGYGIPLSSPTAIKVVTGKLDK